MKIKYIYYNANPHNLYVEDCVIRAISKCENITWEETFKNLFDVAIKIKNVMNSKQCLHTYLSGRYSIEEVNIPLEKFKLKNGKRLLLMKTTTNENYHLLCVENGKYYDTGNLENQRYTVIETYTPILEVSDE